MPASAAPALDPARRRVPAEPARSLPALLEATFHSTPDGLAILDRERRVVVWNARMQALFGIRPEEAVGRGIRVLAGGMFAGAQDARSATTQLLHALRAAPGETEITFEVRLEGDPPRHVELFVFPSWSGEAWHGYGIRARDVSAARELEHHQVDLVSVVSHEMRTPLATIVGFTELLQTRTFGEAEHREALDLMAQASRRLTLLVDDLLDLHRLEQGRLRMAFRPTDVRALLEQAALLARDDPDHPVVLQLPLELPLVRADPDRVQQVLGNLLSNARKYAPRGGRIVLAARATPAGMEVSVQDQGLGIPPEALPRLFEKLYRVPTPQHRSIQGTGLGLAISRQIVEAHGGRIWAESEGLDAGSRFTFTLPVA